MTVTSASLRLVIARRCYSKNTIDLYLYHLSISIYTIYLFIYGLFYFIQFQLVKGKVLLQDGNNFCLCDPLLLYLLLKEDLEHGQELWREVERSLLTLQTHNKARGNDSGAYKESSRATLCCVYVQKS